LAAQKKWRKKEADGRGEQGAWTKKNGMSEDRKRSVNICTRGMEKETYFVFLLYFAVYLYLHILCTLLVDLYMNEQKTQMKRSTRETTRNMSMTRQGDEELRAQEDVHGMRTCTREKEAWETRKTKIRESQMTILRDT
jgi:hypothetical protein